MTLPVRVLEATTSSVQPFVFAVVFLHVVRSSANPLAIRAGEKDSLAFLVLEHMLTIGFSAELLEHTITVGVVPLARLGLKVNT
jgi:hypothetical protein